MKSFLVLVYYILKVLSSLLYRIKLFFTIFSRKFSRLTKRQKPKNKIVVYTAIYGGWDSLKDLPKNISGCDFVCFTDKVDLKSDHFDVRVTRPRNRKNNRRSAKIYKILPHKYFPEYEYSVWIDGSVRIKTAQIERLVDQYLSDHNLAVLAHPDRNCIYEELATCLRANKDDRQLMVEQVDKYEEAGYPSQNGLATCCIIFRRHNSPDVSDFCNEWYKEIEQGSERDQLSFGYVAWKRHFQFETIEEDVRNNQYFEVLKHKKQGPPNESVLTTLMGKIEQTIQKEG